MLITTLQTSTKWERLLNLYIRKQFPPHTLQQVQVSVLLPCRYSHLYHYHSVTILLIRIIMQVTSTVAFFTADIFVMS